MVILVKKAFAVIVLLLVAAGGFLVYDQYGKKDDSEGEPSVPAIMVSDSDVQEAQSETTTEISEEEFIPSVTIECKNSDIHKGELILVNRDFAYVGESNTSLSNIYSMKNDSYYVNSTGMLLETKMINAINNMLADFQAQTGINNILANSGYRSVAEQTELYNADLASTGLETSELVAPPGNSEHHTGYAMDFAINDGESYPAVRNEGEYTWIYDNADKYGMILRYTEENKNITGYMAESWHFRYIGKPHASIVKQTGMAYEEYIFFLKKFTFEEPLEYKYSDNEFYKIYFVNQNHDGDITEVPLTYDAITSTDPEAYSVSGNNMDGFVVTLKVDKLSENYKELSEIVTTAPEVTETESVSEQVPEDIVTETTEQE